jgi:hypothetical protein
LVESGALNLAMSKLLFCSPDKWRIRREQDVEILEMAVRGFWGSRSANASRRSVIREPEYIPT